jgi:spore maturation protein SpmB
LDADLQRKASHSTVIAAPGNPNEFDELSWQCEALGIDGGEAPPVAMWCPRTMSASRGICSAEAWQGVMKASVCRVISIADGMTVSADDLSLVKIGSTT